MSKNDIEKKQTNTGLAKAFGQGEKETGFEGLKSKDFAIPYIALLQPISPQVMPGKSKFMPDARPGMFLDSATEELSEKMRIIPCFYRNSMVEWVPREKGGGFVAAHEPGMEKGLDRNDKGQYLMKGKDGKENGNVIMDTRYFFCLQLKEEGDPRMVVLALQSTQIKKAKNWLTKMDAMRAVGEGGVKFKPPMFSHTWVVSSLPEQNQKGSYFGYKIEVEGPITDEKLYNQAKKAMSIFKESTVQVQAPDDAEPVDTGKVEMS